jgi:MSHA biogenesis protein MshI
VVADPASVRVARVAAPEGDGRPRVVSFGEQTLPDDARALRAALRELGVGKVSDGATVLPPADYQFIVVERADVPSVELHAAMKWKLKDVAGASPEEFSFDLLAIPGADGDPDNARSLFAVVSPNEKLRARVAKLDQARFRVNVIDVAETAQRNLATLFEQTDRGTAFFFLDDWGGLLTISFRGELYHTRRLELRYSEIAVAQDEARTELFDRVVLEIQRTLDNFERQFSFITLNRVLLGPEPEDLGLAAYLRANLSLPVEAATLEQVIDFPGEDAPTPRDQWRFFHLFGSALRGRTQ